MRAITIIQSITVAGGLHMIRWIACLVFALALGEQALAQPFPSKPVHIVVPYTTGGGTDTMARLLADFLSKDLGQPIVVDNKPGAGGSVGAAQVARSPADGYTILLTAGGFVIAPSVLKNPGYDPVKDFVGLSQIAIVPLIVVTRPDSPLKTFADLIALAKRDGDKVNFGSFGNGTPSQLVGVEINRLAGVKMTHVPYKGTSASLPDLLSGRIDVAILDAVSMTPWVKDGRLKALAVTGPKRIPALSGLPTLVELGVNFDAVGWHGAFLPAGVPAPIVKRLNAAFTKAISQPEIRKRIIETGSIPIEPPLTPEQWTTQYRHEVDQWADVVRTAGIRPH
jgi:tripartite-type tricarboxylate transporter receptor subunit TctC